MTIRWPTLLWDLDGTITDPRHGIIGAYQKFLEESGVEMIREDELLWVIGPPLRDCMRTLLKTDDSATIEHAVTRYRHWYVQEGYMYKDTPYPGIEGILAELKKQDVRMFVATAKAHTYAKQILKHWNLDHYFEAVHGSELDGTRSNKAELLKWMLEQYSISPSRQIAMLGDRKHDAIAGKANGLTTIGVGYGYGSKSELTAAGVDFYCPQVIDLQKLLVNQ